MPDEIKEEAVAQEPTQPAPVATEDDADAAFNDFAATAKPASRETTLQTVDKPVDAKPDAKPGEKPAAPVVEDKPDGDAKAEDKPAEASKPDEKPKVDVPAKSAKEQALDAAKADQTEAERQRIAAEADRIAKDREAREKASAEQSVVVAPADIAKAIEDDLKGLTFSGDSELATWDQIKKQYGEPLMNAIAAVSLSVARKVADELRATAIDPVRKTVAESAQERYHENFLQAMERDFGIADVRQIEADSKFQGFLKANPEFSQVVATGSKKGTALVLKAFREEFPVEQKTPTAADQAKADKSAADKAKRDKDFKKEVELGTSTARKGPVTPPVKTDERYVDEDDADKLFAETAKQLAVVR